jgi:hypothetical protein
MALSACFTKEAKLLSFLSTFLLPHSGQAMVVSERTSNSKSPLQEEQRYSKIGIGMTPFCQTAESPGCMKAGVARTAPAFGEKNSTAA